MSVQAPRLTVHRVRAADQNPASRAQVIRHLLKRTPWQRCPGFFCSEQQDQAVAGIPGDSEVTASRWSRELVPRSNSLTNSHLDRACHDAITTQLRSDVDALS